MNSNRRPKRTSLKAISEQTSSIWLDPNHFMPVLVTFAVLCSALYMILWQQQGMEAQKWSYGALGTILGFWLNRQSST